MLSSYYMEDIQQLVCPTAVLPAGTGIGGLKRFSSECFRFRGAIGATSIDDFVRYPLDYAKEDEKARRFIDTDNILARSILNIGVLNNPGHANNIASIKLRKTAPFRALLSISGDHLNQKQIAE